MLLFLKYLVNTKAHDCHTIGSFYGVNGKKLQRQYRDHISDFKEWSSKSHAKDWLVFPENMGTHLSIDETALSQGELYTILTNKAAKGKKGSIVAIITGTKAEQVIEHILKIPKKLRNNVKEITLDMAPCMKLVAKKCFSKAIQVTDRFHVQRLTAQAVQDIRIKHRWLAIDQENELIQHQLSPEILSNGDTKKQLLARSRYLLYKSPNKWTENQKERANILFTNYPEIEKAYKLAQGLRDIFNFSANVQVAYTKLARWYNKVENSGFKSFNTIARTISINYRSILNYFINRSTNASAESFNAKIKAFRSQFRGVKNIEFFLFRLTRIFA